ncbi:hypothetical protein J4437_06005 [Candidatus Woesearchaeota archaeon]|nr:hypothetical protein [Candidatus Woesearchaeota archaeon]
MVLKKISKFLILFFLTIFLVRLLVVIVQEKSIVFLGSEVHHMFIGIILVLLSGFSKFFSKNSEINKWDLILFAVGSGLIVDEVAFLIFTEGTHLEYFSMASMLGAGILAVVLVLLYYLIYDYEKKEAKTKYNGKKRKERK